MVNRLDIIKNVEIQLMYIETGYLIYIKSVN